jgi:hypothetical protein
MFRADLSKLETNVTPVLQQGFVRQFDKTSLCKRSSTAIIAHNTPSTLWFTLGGNSTIFKKAQEGNKTIKNGASMRS